MSAGSSPRSPSTTADRPRLSGWALDATAPPPTTSVDVPLAVGIRPPADPGGGRFGVEVVPHARKVAIVASTPASLIVPGWHPFSCTAVGKPAGFFRNPEKSPRGASG